MGFGRFLFEMTKAGAGLTKKAVKESKNAEKAAAAARKKAYVNLDIAFSCQEEKCTIHDDYNSYIYSSKYAFDLCRKITVISLVVLLIVSVIFGGKYGIVYLIPLIGSFRFGQSLPYPLARVLQDWEAGVKKRHNFSAIKIIIPLISLVGVVLYAIDGAFKGNIGQFILGILGIILILGFGVLGYYRQHFCYTSKIYSIDTRKIFEENGMLKHLSFATISEVKITNNALYFDDYKQQIVRWSNLTDYGAVCLAKCYSEDISNLGYEVEATVFKKYVNGTDMNRERAKKKSMMAKKATGLIRHAGANAELSGYVLSEIIIKKIERAESRKISKLNDESIES